MTTDERIKKIFDTIGVDLTNIKNNTNLLELGILDSLKMVQLITGLESEFSISFKVDDLNPENFCTLERIIALLEKPIDEERS